MPAPTPPTPIAAVPATPDRNEGEIIFVPKMYNFLDYFAPFKAYLQLVVTYCADAISWITGLESSAAASAESADDSKNEIVGMVGGFNNGNQGSWPTAITTRNDSTPLQEGDTFFYTGTTGGGYTQYTLYRWNDTLNQWEVAPVPGVFIKKRQIITASTTWNKPPKFVEGSLLLSGCGGGASGCSSGASNIAGGNSGEWVYQMTVDVSAVSSVTVTIGPGGTSVNGGGVNTAGNAGGATTFGALVSLAGAAATPATGGRAATVGGPLGGILNSSSTPSLIAQTNPSAIGGNGGIASAPGAGSNADGAGGIVVDATGTKAGNASVGSAMGGIGYGAGGGSSTVNSSASGAGSAGVLVLEWEERQ